MSQRTRISRVSRAVKLLAYALFWVSAIVGLVSLIGVVRIGDTTTRVVSAYGAVAGPLFMGICWHVARLSKLYEEGRLFTADNVRHLKWVGRLTLLTAIAPTPVPDAQTESIGVGVEFYPAVVLVSLVLLFLSWVMDEARKLEDEAELVI